MIRIGRKVLGTIVVLVASGNAMGALLGDLQSFPDVTLNQNYIIYDHNGIDGNSGLFRIASLASTLNSVAGGPASSTQTQTYAGAGDSTADVMLSIQINNLTGALEAGSVTIGFGNSTTAPRFSWQGTITEFGFLDNGTAFDARWTLNGDQYQNMPAPLSAFVNGRYAGANGGIKISNSSGFGAGNTWTNMLSRDWVFGTSVQSGTAVITPYLTGLDAIGNPAGRVQLNSTVTVDAFVPLPAAAWLMLSGLGLMGFCARRKGAARA